MLLQVVFHAQLAQEQSLFGFEDVLAGINEKLVRRHPHVFDAQEGASATDIKTAAQQTKSWELLKKQERERKSPSDKSVLAGIAAGMPEWQRALKLQKRAATVGFDWPEVECVFEKLQEEILEVREEFKRGVGHEALQDEIGDILFVCVNLARHAKVDFGAALRHANRKFETRFRAMEQLAEQRRISLTDLALAEQEDLWQQVKLKEKTA